jgi:PTS system cellobiose-specific IIA component
MEKINNTESATMNLIANSGDGRSYAFQALEEARNGNLEECNLLLRKSDDAIKKAHQAQTELLFSEARGEKQEINVLLIHSQDHFMTSMLANELIKEIIRFYQK